MSGALRFEKILLEQVANADGRPQGSSIALEQPQRVARAINLDLVEHCIAAIAPVASGLASRAAFSALAGSPVGPIGPGSPGAPRCHCAPPLVMSVVIISIWPSSLATRLCD